MHDFADFVLKPCIRQFGYVRILEIGAQYGENTDELAELPSVHVTVIDPCVDADLCARHAGNNRIAIRKGLSLDVLPDLTQPFDCILIDGDHNWYTVYNELRIIRERELLLRGGAIFLHDTWWPYGRRDGYYAPDRIPAQYRQPFAYQGIVRGQSALSESEGVNAQIANATHEGGPRNGVLTAVEDFLHEYDHKYLFFNLRLQYGLGTLYRRRDRECDSAFSEFHRDIQWRLRVGRVKDFVRAMSPSIYTAARRIAKTLRGERPRE
ncbi:MAG: class I SAM-dependent methyltransferase [Candidatus Hydrogenedentes bacterium]|nr:class I SAM-dependent methyltransferase [Candidatus Hydrogenedentota bacterium]